MYNSPCGNQCPVWLFIECKRPCVPIITSPPLPTSVTKLALHICYYVHTIHLICSKNRIFSPRELHAPSSCPAFWLSLSACAEIWGWIIDTSGGSFGIPDMADWLITWQWGENLPSSPPEMRIKGSSCRSTASQTCFINQKLAIYKITPTPTQWAGPNEDGAIGKQVLCPFFLPLSLVLSLSLDRNLVSVRIKAGKRAPSASSECYHRNPNCSTLWAEQQPSVAFSWPASWWHCFSLVFAWLVAWLHAASLISDKTGGILLISRSPMNHLIISPEY